MPLILRYPVRYTAAMSIEGKLALVASAYEQAAAARGGRSLSRIATIVINRGSFFNSLREGRTCSVRTLEKLIDYFSAATNWPGGDIPPLAMAELNVFKKLMEKSGDTSGHGKVGDSLNHCSQHPDAARTRAQA